MPTTMLLPLELLEPGEWAEVVEIRGDGAWIHRLAEMGIRAGSHLLMARKGNPCLVHVGGLRLSLRNNGRAEITVRPLGVAEPVA